MTRHFPLEILFVLEMKDEKNNFFAAFPRERHDVQVLLELKKVAGPLLQVINMWTLTLILLPFLLQNKFYSLEGYFHVKCG